MDDEIKILTPEPASYLCFLQDNLNEYEEIKKRYYLINQYSPSSNIDRDIHNLLLAEFNQLIIPTSVHTDLHISEALAQKQTAYTGAPHSQAFRDFKILSNWLTCLFAENSANE